MLRFKTVMTARHQSPALCNTTGSSNLSVRLKVRVTW